MSAVFSAALRRVGMVIACMALAAAAPSAATAAPNFSLLSYNVHGLPWPLASGRPDALLQISARLRDMRLTGRQPHVVVIQEAFTETDRQILRGSGYRYSAEGPAADLVTPVVSTAADKSFAAGGRWLKGESVGRVFGSGLMILSDYPIAGVRRAAFPAFACAGYDCLANKGAMIATISLPGGNAIAVATTHLNSRASSGVDSPRSDQAYRRQIDILDQFLAESRDPRVPLVVAGDFNVGKAAPRRAYIAQAAQHWSIPEAKSRVDDSLHSDCQLAVSTARSALDFRAIKRRAKDWQFFTAGTALRITAQTLSIPFGHAADGSMLSDHIGYVTHYLLAPRVTAQLNRRDGAGGPRVRTQLGWHS